MDKEYAKACSACESTRKPVHCPDCLNGPILKEKRLQLQQLQAQKGALLEQLVPQLALRVSVRIGGPSVAAGMLAVALGALSTINCKPILQCTLPHSAEACSRSMPWVFEWLSCWLLDVHMLDDLHAQTFCQQICQQACKRLLQRCSHVAASNWLAKI